MWNKNIETFLGCDKEYDEAEIVLFGVPFDSTTSFRPGTRFASKAMRGDSFGLETYSPYQNRDLTEMFVFDGGDLELPFGNPRVVLNQIREQTKKILSDNKIPVMIGGEHLVTLGTMEAVIEKYKEVHVIHFDAHADLREDYLGETLSHATVLHRVWDLIGDGRIHQFGIRSGDREELEWGKQHVNTQLFSFEGLFETMETLQGKPIYLTLDLDVLDPSVFPGTGTPEAGGVTFCQLLDAILMVGKGNVIGCDIVELSPSYDHSGVSTQTACKVLRELLISLEKRCYVRHEQVV